MGDERRNVDATTEATAAEVSAEAMVAPTHEAATESPDEVLVEEVSIDGMCGVY